jgi:hypothetical protein
MNTAPFHPALATLCLPLAAPLFSEIQPFFHIIDI